MTEFVGVNEHFETRGYGKKTNMKKEREQIGKTSIPLNSSWEMHQRNSDEKQIKFVIQQLPRNFYSFGSTGKMAKVFPNNHEPTVEDSSDTILVSRKRYKTEKHVDFSPIILGEIEKNKAGTLQNKSVVPEILIEPEVVMKPKPSECIVTECEQEICAENNLSLNVEIPDQNRDEICKTRVVANKTKEEIFSKSDATVVEILDQGKSDVGESISRSVSFYIRQMNDEVQVDVLKIQLTQLKNEVKKKLPAYGKHFGKVFSTFGYHFCKIHSSPQLPFELLRRNYWRFMCTRIAVSKTNLKVTTQADSTTDIPYVWRIRSTLDPTVDIGWDSPYPYYVTNLVKALENYFNKHITLPAKVYDNDKIDIVMQRNSTNDVMVIVVVHDNEIDIYNSLYNFVIDVIKTITYLKGFQYVTDVPGNKDGYRKIVLFGEDNLVDTIHDLTVEVPSDPNVVVNYNYVKHLSQVIESYLVPCKDTILFELNCKMGLSTLLLASKYKEVMGFGDRVSIQRINTVINKNSIWNACFDSDGIMSSSELNLKIQNVVPISAIINNDEQCEFFHFVLNELLTLTTLKRLVIVTESFDNLTETLLAIMKPRYSSLFVPVSCRIVDKLLDNNTYDIVLFMERVPADKMCNFFAKRKSPKKRRELSHKKYGKDDLCDEPVAKKHKVEAQSEYHNLQNLKNEAPDHPAVSQTGLILTNEASELLISSENCSVEDESVRLTEQIFNELITAMTDCNDEEPEETVMTASDNSNPLESTQESRISEKTVENSEKSPAMESTYSEGTVNDKEKIVSYSKRLQCKLGEILEFMKKHSHIMDPKKAKEIKLMTSSMLKTGLKIQEKIGIRNKK